MIDEPVLYLKQLIAPTHWQDLERGRPMDRGIGGGGLGKSPPPSTLSRLFYRG